MSFAWVKLLIVVALKEEVPACLRTLSCTRVHALKAHDTRQAQENSLGILTVITGVGKQGVADLFSWFDQVDCRPYLVLNLGSCGSTEAFKKGSMLCPRRFRHPQKDQHIESLGCFPFLIKTPINIIDEALTVDRFSEQHRAACIDMEAYFLAQSCHERQLPFSALKVLSDANTHAEQFQINVALKSVAALLHGLISELLTLPKDPKISVIIPTFNRQATLKRCLDSVLGQSQPCFECWVVDDGSSDDSLRLLETYQGRVQILKHQKNQGVSAARNAAIARAGGDWIMFLDSDDEWTPDKILKQCDYLKRYPYFSILQSEERWIRHGKPFKKKKIHQKKAGFIWELCLQRCMISPSSVMIKRELLSAPYSQGFDTDFVACEDYDLWLQLSRQFLVGLDDTCSLIKYGGHEDQLSVQTKVLDRYRIMALKKALFTEKQRGFRRRLEDDLQRRSMIVEQGQLKRKKSL